MTTTKHQKQLEKLVPRVKEVAEKEWRRMLAIPKEKRDDPCWKLRTGLVVILKYFGRPDYEVITIREPQPKAYCIAYEKMKRTERNNHTSSRLTENVEEFEYAGCLQLDRLLISASGLWGGGEDEAIILRILANIYNTPVKKIINTFEQKNIDSNFFDLNHYLCEFART